MKRFLSFLIMLIVFIFIVHFIVNTMINAGVLDLAISSTISIFNKILAMFAIPYSI